MGKLEFFSGGYVDAESFMAEQKAYAKLKNSELDSIPKNKLVGAVTAWVEGKFNENWSDMCEVINGLSTPCLYVYCADYITREIMNGGFSQLFFNLSRDYVGAGVSGFRAIGYNEAADIAERALKINEENCGSALFKGKRKLCGQRLPAGDE